MDFLPQIADGKPPDGYPWTPRRPMDKHPYTLDTCGHGQVWISMCEAAGLGFEPIVFESTGGLEPEADSFSIVFDCFRKRRLLFTIFY